MTEVLTITGAAPGAADTAAPPPGANFERYFSEWLKLRAWIDTLDKLFVVGCAKSGTNWIQKLLNAHPQVVVLGEGRFFWQLAPFMTMAIRSFNKAVASPGEVIELRDLDFHLLMRIAIDNQLARYVQSAPRKPGLRIVGDKTPMHSIAMPELNRLYPQAKFIHILRDPRDATISQWFFWAQKNDPRPFEEFVRYSITKVWPLNVQSARQAGRQYHGRYAEVRYEDLHTDVTGELRRLFGFLGVDSSAETAKACGETATFEKLSGGRPRGETQAGNLFRRGVVGDWREHIPAELADSCCAEIAGLMRECGYEPRSSA